MQIVAISDTHGIHRNVSAGNGDTLVHAGDITVEGEPATIADFVDWLSVQPFTHKVFIAGNHDRWAESETAALRKLARDAGVHYLHCDGVELDGVRFWGSPYTPEFMQWSFMYSAGDDAVNQWSKVPAGTDVLVTHGPPAGILDELLLPANAPLPEAKGVGCTALRDRINELDIPLHIFGHIHEGHGAKTVGNCQYINASLVNNQYELVNKPQCYDLASARLTSRAASLVS